MKRTLREHVQPPLKIGDASITRGSIVSFACYGKKHTGKASDTYTSEERIFYCFDRAISDDGKVVENMSIRDDDILKIELSNYIEKQIERWFMMRLAEAKEILRESGYKVFSERHSDLENLIWIREKTEINSYFL